MKKLIAVLMMLGVLCNQAMAAGTLGAFNLSRDGNNQNTFIRTSPGYIDARVLAANVAETYTLTTGAQRCLFSADGNFYARPNATAAVPAADVSDGTASELNPTSWYVGNLTTIGLISTAATVVTISCYN